MILEVRTFANLCEFSGWKTGEALSVEIQDDSTVNQLSARIGIPEQEINLVIVNGRLVPKHHVLQHGDRVSLFPPIGGG